MDRKLSHERGLVQEDCDELIDADEFERCRKVENPSTEAEWGAFNPVKFSPERQYGKRDLWRAES